MLLYCSGSQTVLCVSSLDIILPNLGQYLTFFRPDLPFFFALEVWESLLYCIQPIVYDPTTVEPVYQNDQSYDKCKTNNENVQFHSEVHNSLKNARESRSFEAANSKKTHWLALHSYKLVVVGLILQ